jgi:hypothetical protein
MQSAMRSIIRGSVSSATASPRDNSTTRPSPESTVQSSGSCRSATSARAVVVASISQTITASPEEVAIAVPDARGRFVFERSFPDPISISSQLWIGHLFDRPPSIEAAPSP